MCFLVLAAIVVADGFSFGAQAYTTQTWNTTALFNGGTKASTGTATDTCENVTANGLALNNTGNYQGIGLTTGTSTCATGAWGVNPSGLVLAYDMQTLSNGKMKDFSGSGNDGTITGTTNQVGRFGAAKIYSTGNKISTASSTSVSGSSLISVDAWFKFTPSAAFKAIAAEWNSGADYVFWVGMNNINIIAVQILTNPTQTTATFGGARANNTWYNFGFSWDGANLYGYLNGTPVAGSYITHFSGPAAVSTAPLTVGWYPSVSCLCTIDEVQVWKANLSASSFSKLATDGRFSFLSSGSWQSPNVAFTTSPASVTLTGTGFTAANRPSRLRFLSSSGTVVFDQLIPSGLTSPIQIPVNLTFNPAQWSVKLDMIGNGTATAKMTSILVTLGAAPLFQTSDILFLFGILLLVLSVLCFFTDSPELDLLSFFAAMGFTAWSWLYFFAAFNNSVFALIGIGLGAIVMVLTLGKLTGDVTA